MQTYWCFILTALAALVTSLLKWYRDTNLRSGFLTCTLHVTRDTRDTRDTWHAITHHVDVLDVAAVLGQVHEVDVPGVVGYHDCNDDI